MYVHKQVPLMTDHPTSHMLTQQTISHMLLQGSTSNMHINSINQYLCLISAYKSLYNIIYFLKPTSQHYLQPFKHLLICCTYIQNAGQGRPAAILIKTKNLIIYKIINIIFQTENSSTENIIQVWRVTDHRSPQIFGLWDPH